MERLHIFPMTQAKPKPLTFSDYLNYDDGSDSRYDLLSSGELVPIPNESEENDYLAMVLFMKLSALINFRLIKPHTLTMEVEPVGDRYKNRRPDEKTYRGSETVVSEAFPTLQLTPDSLFGR